MLEIKNLTKIYKTKGGVETKAVDDVSINFASTGLVFLLGKSGSGKSTLLNLVGGLDKPTSGEVIVMGKSSKDFSASDFDSYRNTYVGFVFQEYNILNEFSVEENVALALELQGKKKNAEKLTEILEEVELTEFAKRKPNTLSGGQKQRIAIARALIKAPQIILADEPTGALDSVTGRQVMETLKKLSETRLVLVVSHDREFAELYGDRIVELKDGKVISDVSKVRSQADKLAGNIVRLNDDTITVKKGTKLSAKDIELLQKFISEGDSDVLVSKNNEDIANFKRANRIDDEGVRENFFNTPEDSVKPYSGETAKFIRSRLPASKAFKIGASNLKIKPFRLILTILLTVVSFVMFGLFSTMMLYNPKNVIIQSFIQSDYDYLTIQKAYVLHVTTPKDKYDKYMFAQLTQADVQGFGPDAIGAYTARFEYPSNVTVLNSVYYYVPQFNKVAVVPEGHPMRKSMIGAYPQNVNEIAVSSYFAEVMQNSMFRKVDDSGNVSVKPINSYSDLIGESITLPSTTLKITGVFDSGKIPSKYDNVKKKKMDNSDMEIIKFNRYIEEGVHTLALVTDDFITEHSADVGYSYDDPPHSYFDETVTIYDFFSLQNGESCDIVQDLRVWDKDDSHQMETIMFKDVNSLQDNQVILQLQAAYSLINEHWFSKYYYDSFWDNWQSEYETEEDAQLAWNNLKDAYRKFRDAYSTFNTGNVTITEWVENPGGGGYFNVIERHPASDEELATAKEVMLEYFNEHLPTKIGLRVNFATAGEVELVGVYIDAKDNHVRGAYCSQSMYDSATFSNDTKKETKYWHESDAQYDFILAPFEKKTQPLRVILDRIEVVDEERDVVYYLDNRLYDDLRSVNNTIEMLSTIFLWIGVGMAAFAGLMLFNFISVSISNKNKEIGILRAVGARGLDVFKIFFAESGIIVGICLVLSIIGSAIAAALINGMLKAEIGFEVVLIVFVPLSIALMIGVACVVAVIATFLPVYLAARKKPVDSIRAL